jgi:hypothetical protein
MQEHKYIFWAYLNKYLKYLSQDSIVSIGTGYKRDDQGVVGRVKNYFLLQSIQAGSGALPTSYPTSTGGSLPVGKVARYETGHSAPTSPRVKKMWIYTSTPQYIFMAQHKFIFTLSQEVLLLFELGYVQC